MDPWWPRVAIMTKYAQGDQKDLIDGACWVPIHMHLKAFKRLQLARSGMDNTHRACGRPEELSKNMFFVCVGRLA
jgi:hypothetical protein